MDINEISDRVELEKLVSDYATAIDSRDFKQLNNLFTPDAQIDYTAVGGIAGSLAEIIAFLETALDFFPNYQHFISNISLTINGNTATGKVMCFNPMQTKDSQVFFLGMWYQDTYLKVNDKWFISSRIEESSWSHNVPVSVNTDPQQ